MSQVSLLWISNDSWTQPWIELSYFCSIDGKWKNVQQVQKVLVTNQQVQFENQVQRVGQIGGSGK